MNSPETFDADHVATPLDPRHEPANGDEVAFRPGSFSLLAAVGAVHDLGNLIQVAASAVSVVTRTPDMPADRARAIFARAKTSLDQAAVLVRQTVRLTRDLPPASNRSDVAACLIEVLALVDSMADSNFVLQLDVEPGLPDVRCEPLGLQRAVLNLIFNAREAMAGSGAVLIQAQAVWSGMDMVEFRVIDSGVGMSSVAITRAFEPFFTTKPDGLGGIGLPMVERFVRDAGGEIAIDSTIGAGTTVTLRLPMIDTLPTDSPAGMGSVSGDDR